MWGTEAEGATSSDSSSDEEEEVSPKAKYDRRLLQATRRRNRWTGQDDPLTMPAQVVGHALPPVGEQWDTAKVQRGLSRPDTKQYLKSYNGPRARTEFFQLFKAKPVR